jgi:hypothetical protein
VTKTIRNIDYAEYKNKQMQKKNYLTWGICLFLFLPVLVWGQNVHKSATVLFIGDSYTSVNNLPLLVYEIALANGDTLIYDSNTPGGTTLEGQFDNATTLSKINERLWQYVVLQAQSQEPSFSPSYVDTETLPYALKLDSVVKHRNGCANTVFYETWGRQYGDTMNCPYYPPSCTYSGMQSRLEQSYKIFADNTKGIVSPVGEAFRKSITLNSNLDLYMSDQSHPSLSGSYLAAAVFYEVLFQKSVLANAYNPGIALATVTFLQQVADATVNDSLSFWNLGSNLPWAGFSMNQKNTLGYQFQSSSPSLNNVWYFGDGDTSHSGNAVHTYAISGTYVVSHVVENECQKDSVSETLIISLTGIQKNSTLDNQISLYPNPCTHSLYIKNATHFKTNNSVIEIRNETGELVQKSIFSELIDTDRLPDGIYFITIRNSSEIMNARFIKCD